VWASRHEDLVSDWVVSPSVFDHMVSLIAGWFLIGATHRGQSWTPALTLPHVRYGLSVLRMVVLCTFSMPSMCRHVRRQLMRNELLDFTIVVPTTTCRQRNYVKTYSRKHQGIALDSRSEKAASIMASATPAASVRGTNTAAPEDSVVLTEAYYIFVPFLYIYYTIKVV